MRKRQEATLFSWLIEFGRDTPLSLFGWKRRATSDEEKRRETRD